MEETLKKLINENEVSVNYFVMREADRIVYKVWSGEQFIETNPDYAIDEFFRSTPKLRCLLNVKLNDYDLSGFLMRLSETLELITIEDNSVGLNILLR